MIKQEINLYRPFDLPIPDVALITWRQYLLANGAMVAMLTIIYFSMLWQAQKLHTQKELLSTQNIQLKHQFIEEKSKYPSLFFTQDVQQTLQQMEKTLAAQSKFFSAISHPTYFSQQLLALSQIDIASVWLTDISISNADKRIVLIGNTLSANDLQTYLANLGKNPLFAESELTINNVEGSKIKENTLAFEITIAGQT